MRGVDASSCLCRCDTGRPMGIVGTEFDHGAVAFFELEARLKLALWPRKSLAIDSGLPLGQPRATEFSLGHNVSSKEEVNAVVEQARNSGAVIVKPAQDTFWGGYAGYFRDPDNHLGKSPESCVGGERRRRP